ncbi:MAG: transport permease protein [Candidatus Binatia bacterium]|nr:MAG: transport permease protein [Candidatus Binatia bacterium]
MSAGAAVRLWLLPVWGLWWREMVRFVRQRSRVTGALLQPLVFWLVLGGGLNASFRPAGVTGVSYVAYFFPGTIVLVLLFTAVFATIATVEDRKSGFLQGVLVAPVPRPAIVLGQLLGSTTLATIQGTLMLCAAPLVGIRFGPGAAALAVLLMALMGLALSGLGLSIAWRMDSTQGFHAVMNLLLLPMWFLSGAVFPMTGAPFAIQWLMTLNPLMYGVAALRRSLYWAQTGALEDLPSLGVGVGITILFAVLAFVLATRSARRHLW